MQQFQAYRDNEGNLPPVESVEETIRATDQPQRGETWCNPYSGADYEIDGVDPDEHDIAADLFRVRDTRDGETSLVSWGHMRRYGWHRKGALGSVGCAT